MKKTQNKTTVLATCGIRRPEEALRTPHRSSCSLPNPKRKRIISSIISLNFTKGNVHRAEDSHVCHKVDTPLSSVNAPPLRRLDQTTHHLAAALDADRHFQEQVRAGGRKCTVTSATDHAAATGETACLYQNGSHTPGASGQDGSKLETSPPHCSARDAAAVASSRLQTLLEVQVEGSFS